MAMVAFSCRQCGQTAERKAGEVNRSVRSGRPLFCGKKCFGLSRRQNKAALQRKAEKAVYDAQYRRVNGERLRAAKAAYHKRTYNPATARIKRKERASYHAEYCRAPSYRRWKATYDARRRAKKYGAFADAYTLLLAVERECLNRMSRYEIDLVNGKLNKALKRRREDGQTVSS